MKEKYRNVKNLTDLKWLNIKEVVEPEKGVKGFQFAERKGVNSIAFIGYDAETNEYLLVNEYLPPVGHFLTRAFGGSIDKDATPLEIARMEIEEEAGYDVEYSDIIYLGSVFVSSMMNQYCYLFIFQANDAKRVNRTTEDPIELLSTVKRLNKNDIYDLQDWKAITIMSKYQNLLKK